MRRSGIPGIIGNAGWDRASAWTWDFSSTLSTTAARAGCDTARRFVDLVHEQRIGRQLEPVGQVRFEPERPPDPPDRRLAQPAVGHLLRDQWVAFAGVYSSVATTTSSTWAAVIVGGRPGRGSSISPSSRWATKRPRHLPTVAAARPAGPPPSYSPSPRHMPARSGSATPAPGTTSPSRPPQQLLPLVSSQRQLGLWPSRPRHGGKPNLSHPTSGAAHSRSSTTATRWAQPR